MYGKICNVSIPEMVRLIVEVPDRTALQKWCFNSRDGAIDSRASNHSGERWGSFNSRDGAIDRKILNRLKKLHKLVSIPEMVRLIVEGRAVVSGLTHCFNSRDGAIDSLQTSQLRFECSVSIPEMVRLIE